jgi:integrase
MHALLEFAMWAGLLPMTRNPISLVQNKGATRKVRKARSLTVEQFQALLTQLHEPFATMAVSCVCLGLRISEALALRWADVDWLGGRLSVQRGIVERIVDDVKTEGSAKTFNLVPELLDRLKSCKQVSQFSGPGDWIFASPLKSGELPYSYTGVWRELVRAADLSKIGHLGTHAFRHTYRSWLDAVGTPVTVQQKMMRHADIRTTFNIYGDVVTDEMTTASSKVAELAFGGRAQDRAQSA